MRQLFSAVCFVALLFAAPALRAEGKTTEPNEPAVAQGEHGGHAEHVPSFDDINWFYGWFGEREGVEPSLAFRPKGMPAPFGVWILDAVLLYGFLFRVAKQPVRKALEQRKANIMRGIDEAARMKREAEVRLKEYESKLALIDEEVARVRREMREDAEAERTRILADARARRERVERDAHQLVAQELAAARETLTQELIQTAMNSAAQALEQRMKAEDQERLAEEYLSKIAKAGPALRGRA
jgi:F0F1-type ATP synthase membrane subunit b/b'